MIESAPNQQDALFAGAPEKRASTPKRHATPEHLAAGEIRYQCGSDGKHLVRYRNLAGHEQTPFLGSEAEAWKVYKTAADDLAAAARKRADND